MAGLKLFSLQKKDKDDLKEKIFQLLGIRSLSEGLFKVN